MSLKTKLSYFGDVLAKLPANSLRVLLYHDIQSQDYPAFKQQMMFAASRHRFIDVAEFDRILTGKQPLQGRNILLTFDDGFKSDRVVAEQILAPLNIKACFFVLPGFIAAADKERFISKHLQATYTEAKVPMDWVDIKYLIQAGHTIGAHTYSHPNLNQITQAEQLHKEIIESGNILQQELGVSVEHFAYPFGKVADISSAALLVAKQRYKYVFSGVRGNNNAATSPLAIRRDEVSPRYSLKYFNFILEGGLAPYYYFARKQLDQKVSAAC